MGRIFSSIVLLMLLSCSSKPQKGILTVQAKLSQKEFSIEKHRLNSHSGLLVMGKYKVCNVSSIPQKFSVDMGTSNNWVTDSQFIKIPESLVTTNIMTSISLNPSECFEGEFNLEIQNEIPIGAHQFRVAFCPYTHFDDVAPLPGIKKKNKRKNRQKSIASDWSNIIEIMVIK